MSISLWPAQYRHAMRSPGGLTLSGLSFAFGLTWDSIITMTTARRSVTLEYMSRMLLKSRHIGLFLRQPVKQAEPLGADDAHKRRTERDADTRQQSSSDMHQAVRCAHRAARDGDQSQNEADKRAYEAE